MKSVFKNHFSPRPSKNNTVTCCFGGIEIISVHVCVGGCTCVCVRVCMCVRTISAHVKFGVFFLVGSASSFSLRYLRMALPTLMWMVPPPLAKNIS